MGRTWRPTSTSAVCGCWKPLNGQAARRVSPLHRPRELSCARGVRVSRPRGVCGAGSTLTRGRPRPSALANAHLASSWQHAAAFARSCGPSPGRAGAALALVHGLDAGDGDGVSLFDEIRGQSLRIGHVRAAWIPGAKEFERGVDGEVGGGDVVEVFPGDREGDRDAGPDAGAIGSDDRGTADPGLGRRLGRTLFRHDPP